MPYLFPEHELEVLKLWEELGIEKKVLAKKSVRGNFVFYEGPPTANAAPALHHVLTRVYKDVVLRFKTMQGFHVDRKAGWDTHGLPVELQVEKKLGISGKPMIESIVPGDVRASIIAFNKECRDMVWKNVGDWESLTKRIGYWLDFKDPYITYDNSYIESLWWVVKQLWDKGLVYKGHKVVPFCTRCGTALSSHEVAQGYKNTTDTSVYVKFKVKNHTNLYMLSWTTTPWTLLGNVALAVGRDITYAYVIVGEETWILAKNQLSIIEGEYTIQKEVKGGELFGLMYEPLFEVPELKGDTAFKVYGASFVTDTDGVGVVHTAVMYGEDDYYLGQEIGLPQFHTVNEEGRFVEATGVFAGKKAKDPETEKMIIEDLKSRGLLIAAVPFKHEYPFCWRCSTPLLYYARNSWFIKMEGMRDAMLERNKTVRWEPEYIRDGRFGEWLAHARDWAISRERYWGTPLPIFECECGETACVASAAEMNLPTNTDLHRPFVDDAKIQCKGCNGTMTRVKEVLDVWFDSGAMPLAQWGFPLKEGSESKVTDHYPADYICEAIDQTRGWFYTLMAVATLLEKPAPYKNVICLGHLLDSKGEKMSKSKGNVIVPKEIIDAQGVDPIRWYFFSMSAAGEPKRFDVQGLEQMKRRTLMIVWNVVEFYSLFKTQDDGERAEPTNVLDQWIIARTTDAVHHVTLAMEAYNITSSVRTLSDLVDDLSTWYVRRSRDRFKDGDIQAIRTLREVLHTIARLFAPFTPFFAESLYNAVPHECESVHLDVWPEMNSITDEQSKLQVLMHDARMAIEVGLSLRATAKIKIRQPLQAFATKTAWNDEFKTIIAEELNVKQVVDAEYTGGEWIQGVNGIALDVMLTEDLKKEGLIRELTRTINGMRKDAGFTLQDRIVIMIVGSGEVLAIIKCFEQMLCESTLAVSLEYGETSEGEKLNTTWGDVFITIAKK